MARPLKHIVDNLRTCLPAIELLDYPLVNCFALTAQTAGKFERGSLSIGHHEELLNDRLHELDRTHASFNVIVVVVPILLDTV